MMAEIDEYGEYEVYPLEKCVVRHLVKPTQKFKDSLGAPPAEGESDQEKLVAYAKGQGWI